MATIGDGFKDIFLAGIGAMAIGAEKSKELVDQFIAKGEITVDQGKQINTELKHKAEEAAATARYDLLEVRMATMTPEERATFAAKAAEFAAKPYPAAEVGDASPVEASATEAGSETPAAPEAPASPETPVAPADGEAPAASQTPGA
ncbi:MAG: hypothetical protein RR178_07385 [Gordonibacter sp.]